MAHSVYVQRCRWCGAETLDEVLDLGQQPHASWFPSPKELMRPEPRWPLRAIVCRACWLVQLGSAASAEPGASQAHPASVSPTMRLGAIQAVDDIVRRLDIDASRQIVEVASHGGYLQPFFAERGLVTHILPSESLFAADRPTGQADVLIDNYLLAHMPDPGAALAAYAALLAQRGDLVVTLDHVLTTIGGRQFDAFRHGHFSYLSLSWLTRALGAQGLSIVDVIELPAYGGALRVFARRAAGSPNASASVEAILSRERAIGLEASAVYEAFGADVLAHRWELRDHLEARRRAKVVVAGYGAPSRATTLLNFAGVTADLLPFTADASPGKWGRLIPGSRIPIVNPNELVVARPAEILILIWDLQSEVVEQLAVARGWNAQFLVPLPRLRVVS